MEDRKKKDFPVLQMPVKGIWKLIKSPGHAKYAFDLVALDEASHKILFVSRIQHFIAQITMDDSYSWGQPVPAPVNGIVVDASDGQNDRQKLNIIKDLWNLMFNRPELDSKDIRPFAGNYIIIKCSGFYVFIAVYWSGRQFRIYFRASSSLSTA